MIDGLHQIPLDSSFMGSAIHCANGKEIYGNGTEVTKLQYKKGHYQLHFKMEKGKCESDGFVTVVLFKNRKYSKKCQSRNSTNNKN
jgi:hypothetical protein